jgi:hypothetical protein
MQDPVHLDVQTADQLEGLLRFNPAGGPIGPVRPEPVEVRPIADGRRACAGLLDEVVAEEAFEGFPGHASA